MTTNEITSTSTSTSTSTTTPTSTTSTLNTPTNISSEKNNATQTTNVGIIAGCAAAGGVLLIIIVIVVVLIIYKKRHRYKPESDSLPSPDEITQRIGSNGNRSQPEVSSMGSELHLTQNEESQGSRSQSDVSHNNPSMNKDYENFSNGNIRSDKDEGIDSDPTSSNSYGEYIVPPDTRPSSSAPHSPQTEGFMDDHYIPMGIYVGKDFPAEPPPPPCACNHGYINVPADKPKCADQQEHTLLSSVPGPHYLNLSEHNHSAVALPVHPPTAPKITEVTPSPLNFSPSSPRGPVAKPINKAKHIAPKTVVDSTSHDKDNAYSKPLRHSPGTRTADVAVGQRTMPTKAPTQKNPSVPYIKPNQVLKTEQNILPTNGQRNNRDSSDDSDDSDSYVNMPSDYVNAPQKKTEHKQAKPDSHVTETAKPVQMPLIKELKSKFDNNRLPEKSKVK